MAEKNDNPNPHRIRTWGKTKPGMHVPIMVREVMRALEPRAGQVVVDCTVGYGGHASEFMKRIGQEGRLIGMDVDGTQLYQTNERLEKIGVPVSMYHASYDELEGILAQEGIEQVDVIFADVGVSSMQVDDSERGISYKHEDAPLDMRMDTRLEKTAADILETISQEELSKALKELSDEPDHERIAEWICLQRNIYPLTTTSQLIRLVMDAKGLTKKTWKKSAATRHGKLHPAARAFQTLRILVNDELGRLERLLEIAPRVLKPGGRIGVLSFHSGEDRLVKEAFRDGYKDGTYQRTSPKPLTPRQSEIRVNPRCESTKFRWAKKA